MYPKVYLKKLDFIQRKHPWIFSGALVKTEDNLHNQLVYVCDKNGNIQATGYYQKSSITVKVLSFSKILVDEFFWKEKIKNAYEYRKRWTVFNDSTNAYRLVFGEADGLPGLIIDNYNGYFVIQAHTEFMHRQISYIITALKEVVHSNFKGAYYQSDFSEECFSEGLSDNSTVILENNLKFFVDWKEGQKTGFFLDQKDNRFLLKEYVADKVVLNTFAYSGGFSVYAAAGNCKTVHSVDSSAKAIEWCNENMILNKYAEKHQSFVADVFDFLKLIDKDTYDVIVLDPPAFAKSIHHKHAAVQAYKRLNVLALNKIKSGGILFTFSCSGIIDKFLFYNTIVAASFESNRRVKILRYLQLPLDHPVIPNFPEGEYLKGLVVYVE